MRMRAKITIAEYLQNDPVHYDFTNDCTDSADYREKTGYEKYFIYRSPKPERFPRTDGIYLTAVSAIEKNYRQYGEIGDPDTESNLLQDIYTILWPDLKKGQKGYMMNKNRICSDTMTSCQTILNDYVERKMPDVLTKYSVKRVSNKICIALYETDPSFRELLDKSKKLKHFIDVYHTLGNYIPVPCGFNAARSGHFGSHDSWDLTLMKIKEYYDARKEIHECIGKTPASPGIKIMELLHRNGEIINCCKWLDSFAGWEDFIDKNFLQDFVGEDYQPRPFCGEHSWECPHVKNFDDFFDEASLMIEKRSEKMVEKLKERIYGTGMIDVEFPRDVEENLRPLQKRY